MTMRILWQPGARCGIIGGRRLRQPPKDVQAVGKPAGAIYSVSALIRLPFAYGLTTIGVSPVAASGLKCFTQESKAPQTFGGAWGRQLGDRLSDDGFACGQTTHSLPVNRS